MYQTDSGTTQTLLLGASIFMYWISQLPGRSLFISGELHVHVYLECSYDPPEVHPGQLAYTSVIHILSTFAPKFQHSLSTFTLNI